MKRKQFVILLTVAIQPQWYTIHSYTFYYCWNNFVPPLSARIVEKKGNAMKSVYYDNFIKIHILSTFFKIKDRIKMFCDELKII